MAKVFAIAPAHELRPRSVTPHRAYEVVSEDGLGFFIRTESGHEARCLWRGCAHLGGGDWTRAVEQPSGGIR